MGSARDPEAIRAAPLADGERTRFELEGVRLVNQYETGQGKRPIKHLASRLGAFFLLAHPTAVGDWVMEGTYLHVGFMQPR